MRKEICPECGKTMGHRGSTRHAKAVYLCNSCLALLIIPDMEKGEAAEFAAVDEGLEEIADRAIRAIVKDIDFDD